MRTESESKKTEEFLDGVQKTGMTPDDEDYRRGWISGTSMRHVQEDDAEEDDNDYEEEVDDYEDLDENGDDDLFSVVQEDDPLSFFDDNNDSYNDNWNSNYFNRLEETGDDWIWNENND